MQVTSDLSTSSLASSSYSMRRCLPPPLVPAAAAVSGCPRCAWMTSAAAPVVAQLPPRLALLGRSRRLDHHHDDDNDDHGTPWYHRTNESSSIHRLRIPRVASWGVFLVLVYVFILIRVDVGGRTPWNGRSTTITSSSSSSSRAVRSWNTFGWFVSAASTTSGWNNVTVGHTVAYLLPNGDYCFTGPSSLVTLSVYQTQDTVGAIELLGTGGGSSNSTTPSNGGVGASDPKTIAARVTIQTYLSLRLLTAPTTVNGTTNITSSLPVYQCIPLFEEPLWLLPAPNASSPSNSSGANSSSETPSSSSSDASDFTVRMLNPVSCQYLREALYGLTGLGNASFDLEAQLGFEVAPLSDSMRGLSSYYNMSILQQSKDPASPTSCNYPYVHNVYQFPPATSSPATIAGGGSYNSGSSSISGINVSDCYFIPTYNSLSLRWGLRNRHVLTLSNNGGGEGSANASGGIKSPGGALFPSETFVVANETCGDLRASHIPVGTYCDTTNDGTMGWMLTVNASQFTFSRYNVSLSQGLLIDSVSSHLTLAVNPMTTQMVAEVPCYRILENIYPLLSEKGNILLNPSGTGGTLMPKNETFRCRYADDTVFFGTSFCEDELRQKRLCASSSAAKLHYVTRGVSLSFHNDCLSKMPAPSRMAPGFYCLPSGGSFFRVVPSQADLQTPLPSCMLPAGGTNSTSSNNNGSSTSGSGGGEEEDDSTTRFSSLETSTKCRIDLNGTDDTYNTTSLPDGTTLTNAVHDVGLSYSPGCNRALIGIHSKQTQLGRVIQQLQLQFSGEPLISNYFCDHHYNGNDTSPSSSPSSPSSSSSSSAVSSEDKKSDNEDDDDVNDPILFASYDPGICSNDSSSSSVPSTKPSSSSSWTTVPSIRFLMGTRTLNFIWQSENCSNVNYCRLPTSWTGLNGQEALRNVTTTTTTITTTPNLRRELSHPLHMASRGVVAIEVPRTMRLTVQRSDTSHVTTSISLQKPFSLENTLLPWYRRYSLSDDANLYNDTQCGLGYCTVDPTPSNDQCSASAHATILTALCQALRGGLGPKGRPLGASDLIFSSKCNRKAAVTAVTRWIQGWNPDANGEDNTTTTTIDASREIHVTTTADTAPPQMILGRSWLPQQAAPTITATPGPTQLSGGILSARVQFVCDNVRNGNMMPQLRLVMNGTDQTGDHFVLAASEPDMSSTEYDMYRFFMGPSQGGPTSFEFLGLSSVVCSYCTPYFESSSYAIPYIFLALIAIKANFIMFVFNVYTYPFLQRCLPKLFLTREIFKKKADEICPKVKNLQYVKILLTHIVGDVTLVTEEFVVWYLNTCSLDYVLLPKMPKHVAPGTSSAIANEDITKHWYGLITNLAVFRYNIDRLQRVVIPEYHKLEKERRGRTFSMDTIRNMMMGSLRMFGRERTRKGGGGAKGVEEAEEDTPDEVRNLLLENPAIRLSDVPNSPRRSAEQSPPLGHDMNQVNPPSRRRGQTTTARPPPVPPQMVGAGNAPPPRSRSALPGRPSMVQTSFNSAASVSTGTSPAVAVAMPAAVPTTDTASGSTGAPMGEPIAAPYVEVSGGSGDDDDDPDPSDAAAEAEKTGAEMLVRRFERLSARYQSWVRRDFPLTTSGNFFGMKNEAGKKDYDESSNTIRSSRLGRGTFTPMQLNQRLKEYLVMCVQEINNLYNKDDIMSCIDLVEIEDKKDEQIFIPSLPILILNGIYCFLVLCSCLILVFQPNDWWGQDQASLSTYDAIVKKINGLREGGGGGTSTISSSPWWNGAGNVKYEQVMFMFYNHSCVSIFLCQAAYRYFLRHQTRLHYRQGHGERSSGGQVSTEPLLPSEPELPDPRRNTSTPPASSVGFMEGSPSPHQTPLLPADVSPSGRGYFDEADAGAPSEFNLGTYLRGAWITFKSHWINSDAIFLAIGILFFLPGFITHILWGWLFVFPVFFVLVPATILVRTLTYNFWIFRSKLKNLTDVEPLEPSSDLPSSVGLGRKRPAIVNAQRTGGAPNSSIFHPPAMNETHSSEKAERPTKVSKTIRFFNHCLVQFVALVLISSGFNHASLFLYGSPMKAQVFGDDITQRGWDSISSGTYWVTMKTVWFEEWNARSIFCFVVSEEQGGSHTTGRVMFGSSWL